MTLMPLYALVVSATAVLGQSTSLPDFNITNLQAGALELSNRAEYRFTVAYALDTQPAACERLTTTPDETMVTVSMTQCGANSTVFFQWNQADDGSAQFIVMNMADGSNVTATRAINSSDIVTMFPGTLFAHEAYNGTTNFSMSAIQA